MKTTALLTLTALGLSAVHAQNFYFASTGASPTATYDPNPSDPANGNANAIIFQVNSTISLTSLGGYNAGNGGTLGGTLNVTLWQKDNGLPYDGGTATQLGSVAVSGAGDFVNGDYTYKNVSFTLSPGIYAIQVQGFNGGVGMFGGAGGDTQPTYETTSGLVTYKGDLAFSSASGNPFPGSVVLTTYNIGSFGFTAVPEPQTYAAAFGLALVGFGLWRRTASKA
jgi:hypothetical protein